MKLEQRLNQSKKLDWFSDAVGTGLGYIGIDQATRDAAQPVIDKGKSLLPSVISPPKPSIGPIPQATGFKYNGSVSPTMILAGVAAVIIVLMLVKK
jgi:hypothetical protein